jgi:hypothetical protein
MTQTQTRSNVLLASRPSSYSCFLCIRVHSRITRQQLPRDFSIDAQHELAVYLMEGINMTHSSALCVRPDPNCATWIQPFEPCVRSILYCTVYILPSDESLTEWMRPQTGDGCRSWRFVLCSQDLVKVSRRSGARGSENMVSPCSSTRLLQRRRRYT